MYKRQVLVDQSPISIKQINDNFAAIFLKVGGNIDTMDLRDGAVKTDKLADGAVTGNKVLDGTLTILNMESDFVSGLDLLENPVFTSLATDVDGHGTLIDQNKETIRLQASSIEGLQSTLEVQAGNITAISSRVSDNTTDISGLRVSYNSIDATVSQNVRDISSARSEISVQAGEIRSRVTYSDFTGANMLSEISQTASRIKIQAKNLDLTGITTVYSNDTDSYLRLGNSYGELYVNHGGHNYFSTRYNIPGVSLRSSGMDFIKADGSEVYFPGDVTFGGNGPVMPRRASDKIEIDVWPNSIVIYRGGSEAGRIYFD